MWQFFICLGIAAVLACWLYGVRLKAVSGARSGGALVSVLMAAALGLLFSKLFYVLFKLDFDSLLVWNFEKFSVFGGAFGVCIAVALCAPLCRVKSVDALNAFAPAGALLLCGVRLGELFLGSYGLIGISDSLFENDWHVCLVEAGVAMLAALLAWWVYDRRVAFMRTAYLICAFQLLTELLHNNQAMFLSFVHIEQVLCAVVMLAIMFLHCRRGISHDDTYRFTPFFWFLAPVAIITYMEFELDKCWIDSLISNIGTDWAYAICDAHEPICYGIILACVLWMLVLQLKALRRRADFQS